MARPGRWSQRRHHQKGSLARSDVEDTQSRVRIEKGMEQNRLAEVVPRADEIRRGAPDVAHPVFGLLHDRYSTIRRQL